MGLLGSEGLQTLWTKIKNLVHPYVKEVSQDGNKLTFTKGNGETTDITIEGGDAYGLSSYSVLTSPSTTYMSAIKNAIQAGSGDITKLNYVATTTTLLLIKFIYTGNKYYVYCVDLLNLKSYKYSIDINTTTIQAFLDMDSVAIGGGSADTSNCVKAVNCSTDPSTTVAPIVDGMTTQGIGYGQLFLLNLNGYKTGSYLCTIKSYGGDTVNVHLLDLNTLKQYEQTGNSHALTITDVLSSEVTDSSDSSSSGGDSSVIDLGEQANHKDAQQAMVDYVSELTDEQGCVLFKYYCTCYGNACFAVVHYYHYREENVSYDVYRGTVYDCDGSYRKFIYDGNDGFVTDGCWLTILSFDEEYEELPTENKTVIGAIYELNEKIGIHPITYEMLLHLKRSGQLVAGNYYRIIDYVCGTSQENTRATDHRFDIIVQAISNTTLSEIAKADFNSEDSYFADNNVNLSAWEIKYCIDNDTTRFSWACTPCITCVNTVNSFLKGSKLTRATSMDYKNPVSGYRYAWTTPDKVDSTSVGHFVWTNIPELTNDTGFCYSTGGYWSIADTFYQHSYFNIYHEATGVIYYMKDEHGNECPYDFKNIQFKRMVSREDGYPALDEENGEETWVYTFCGNSYHIANDEWSELKDGSLESPYMHQSDEHIYTFCNNTMKPYYMVYDIENEDYTKCGKQYLNNNVFFGWWVEVGTHSEDEEYPYHYPYCCAFINLDYNCRSNTFGESSKNIKVGANSHSNYIHGGFIEIGAENDYNTFDTTYLKTGVQCGFNRVYSPITTLGDCCWSNVLEGNNLILLNGVSYIDTTDECPIHKIYKGEYEIV